MVDGKCWQCKFYGATRRDQGKCRRTPPPWVFVDSGDWCGEFRAVAIVGNPIHNDGVFAIEWVDADTVRLTRKEGLTAEQFSDFIKQYVDEVMEEARKLGLKK